VSNVKEMGYIFYRANSFNQPLHAPWYRIIAGGKSFRVTSESARKIRTS